MLPMWVDMKKSSFISLAATWSTNASVTRSGAMVLISCTWAHAS